MKKVKKIFPLTANYHPKKTIVLNKDTHYDFKNWFPLQKGRKQYYCGVIVKRPSVFVSCVRKVVTRILWLLCHVRFPIGTRPYFIHRRLVLFTIGLVLVYSMLQHIRN